jgi:hypothetical protein
VSRIEEAPQRLRLDRKRHEMPHVAPLVDDSVDRGERVRVISMHGLSHG